MASGDVTDRLLAYLRGPEGSRFVFDLVADVGGDPESYGIEDHTAMNSGRWADALRQGLDTAIGSEQVSEDVAVLFESGEVEWSRVAAEFDSILFRAFAAAARQSGPRAEADTPAPAEVARREQERQAAQARIRARAQDQKNGQKILVHHLQAAARSAAPNWERASSGLIYRTADAYCQVVMREPWLDPDGMVQVRITAGSTSKYLLSVWTKQDTTKAPGAFFVAAHAHPLWSYEVRYSTDPLPSPLPFVLRKPVEYHQHEPPRRGAVGPAEHRTLSADTATPWLTGMLEIVVPAVERTSTDADLLDWWLAEDALGGYPNVGRMHNAVLLARHLHRPYDDLLARAEALARERDERWLTEQGRPWTYRDRQTTYPQEWSHSRFVQFVQSVTA